MNQGTRDLTKGNITLQLLYFFLPIAAGNIFHQFYNMVDTIVVGQFIGPQAIAAVGGSASNLAHVYMFISNALISGSSVVIAQRFGAGDEEGVRRSVHTAFTAALIYGAVTMTLLLLFTPQLLTFMDTPSDTFENSLLYLRTYFTGCLFVIVYNIGSNILRAVGDSRRPFLYLAAACTTNIVLDLLFVVVFGLGIFGVAIATVISQMVSAVLVVRRLLRTEGVHRIDPRSLGIVGPFLVSMMHVGIPAMLQSAMYNVANMMVTASVNRLGSSTVAAWALVGKVDGYLFSITGAAGAALLTFVGQNYGARNFPRIRKGVRSSMLIFVGFTLLFSISVLLAGHGIYGLFTKDLSLMYRSFNIMRILLPYYFLWTFVEVFSAALRGTGDVVVPVVICGIGVALFRILWLRMYFPHDPMISTVALCFPISWANTAVAMAIRFYTSGRLRAEISADKTA